MSSSPHCYSFWDSYFSSTLGVTAALGISSFFVNKVFINERSGGADTTGFGYYGCSAGFFIMLSKDEKKLSATKDEIEGLGGFVFYSTGFGSDGESF